MNEFILWLASVMDALADSVRWRRAQESQLKQHCRCRVGDKTILGDCICDDDNAA